jgi:hypothetical protein
MTARAISVLLGEAATAMRVPYSARSNLLFAEAIRLDMKPRLAKPSPFDHALRLMPLAALLLSLNGCIGMAGGTALGAAGGVVSIAKDVFDIDVDVHTLLGQPKATPASAPASDVPQPSPSPGVRLIEFHRVEE